MHIVTHFLLKTFSYLEISSRKMDQVLVSAAKQLERQLDSEIDKLDSLTVDDIDAIREKRMKEMKIRQEKIIQWKTNVSRNLMILRENMRHWIKFAFYMLC